MSLHYILYSSGVHLEHQTNNGLLRWDAFMNQLALARMLNNVSASRKYQAEKIHQHTQIWPDGGSCGWVPSSSIISRTCLEDFHFVHLGLMQAHRISKRFCGALTKVSTNGWSTHGLGWRLVLLIPGSPSDPSAKDCYNMSYECRNLVCKNINKHCLVNSFRPQEQLQN